MSVAERHNLADAEPARVQALAPLWDQYLRTHDVILPDRRLGGDEWRPARSW